MDRFALIIAIIGALNLGSIGIFKYDFLSAMLGGAGSGISRVVFTIVGLAGIWCVSLLFKERDRVSEE